MAPVIPPRERLNAFYPLLDYLGERLGRPVRYVPVRTYAEINKRVIAASPESGMLPVVVRPGLDPALKERLHQVLFGVHRDPEGRAALVALAVDGFVSGDDGAYDVVRSMLADMRQGGGP